MGLVDDDFNNDVIYNVYINCEIEGRGKTPSVLKTVGDTRGCLNVCCLQCDVGCGVGGQTRAIGCRYMDTGDEAGQSCCAGLTQPLRRRDCWSTRDLDCHPSWQLGEYGKVILGRLLIYHVLPHSSHIRRETDIPI